MPLREHWPASPLLTNARHPEHSWPSSPNAVPDGFSFNDLIGSSVDAPLSHITVSATEQSEKTYQELESIGGFNIHSESPASHPPFLFNLTDISDDFFVVEFASNRAGNNDKDTWSNLEPYISETNARYYSSFFFNVENWERLTIIDKWQSWNHRAVFSLTCFKVINNSFADWNIECLGSSRLLLDMMRHFALCLFQVLIFLTHSCRYSSHISQV